MGGWLDEQEGMPLIVDAVVADIGRGPEEGGPLGSSSSSSEQHHRAVLQQRRRRRQQQDMMLAKLMEWSARQWCPSSRT